MDAHEHDEHDEQDENDENENADRVRSDAGIVTAEYAIATLAAAAFAGLLLVILRSGEVRAFLVGIIRQALSV